MWIRCMRTARTRNTTSRLGGAMKFSHSTPNLLLRLTADTMATAGGAGGAFRPCFALVLDPEPCRFRSLAGLSARTSRGPAATPPTHGHRPPPPRGPPPGISTTTLRLRARTPRHPHERHLAHRGTGQDNTINAAQFCYFEAAVVASRNAALA